MNSLILSFVIIEAIIFIVLAQEKTQKNFCIITFFNYAWIYNSVIYLFNPLKYYPIETTVCYFSLVFVLFTNLGFYFKLKKTQINYENLESLENTDIKKQSRIVSFLSIVSWGLSYTRIRNSIFIIMSSGMNELRYETYYSDLYTTSEKLFYQFFVQPLFIVTIILSIESIVFLKRKIKLLIFVSVMNAFVYSVLFGGRSLLVLLIIYFIIAILVRQDTLKNKSIFETIKKYSYLIPLPVFIGYYAKLRINRDWSVFNEYIVYTTGGLVNFSQTLKNETIKGLTFGGLGFLGFIHDFVFLSFRFLTGHSIELISQKYTSCFGEFNPISEKVQVNFIATAMATFYLDFGELGIVVEGFFLGYIFALVDNYHSLKNSIFSLSLYIYFSNVAYETIQNYTLKSIVFLFVMLYLYLLLGLKSKQHPVIGEVLQ